MLKIGFSGEPFVQDVVVTQQTDDLVTWQPVVVKQGPEACLVSLVLAD